MNFLKKIVVILLWILWIFFIVILAIFTLIECFFLIPAAILSRITNRDLKWLWIPDKKIIWPIAKIITAVEDRIDYLIFTTIKDEYFL